MLDVECSINGSVELYLRKVKSQHRNNPRLFEPKSVDQRSFGIQHFAGRVVYDASDFLGKNGYYKHTVIIVTHIIITTYLFIYSYRQN